MLIEAGKANWRDVEPAIFGTLLERALDPIERNRLGAHYTPRAYVERLVLPTVVEPLREEWAAVQTAAVTLARQGEAREAIREVEGFHRKLCATRVLDPACGTGNFLYVTLEHLKRLEGEVLNTLESLGGQKPLEMSTVTVDPHQLLGLEVNPRAAAIAELVLWIGYLQWHFRTRGQINPPEPVIKNFHNIECRDAVLAWDSTEPLLDGQGKIVTRWDGRTMKKHPVTGEDVPDESAQVPAVRYINPRKATWPQAEFVVGNPPFIGKRGIRLTLGDGYVEALRIAHPDVPETSDYVMFWWNHAANEMRSGALKRFGLITTNSIKQPFNRQILSRHMSENPPLRLAYVIPDHPWIDATDGADVRIAMTVSCREGVTGILNSLWEGRNSKSGELISKRGFIQPDLTIGPDLLSTVPLFANTSLSAVGIQLNGTGFLVTAEQAATLGVGKVPGIETHIVDYLNGRDMSQVSRNLKVIDLFGLSLDEVRIRYPSVYQWVFTYVKPERDQNPRDSRRVRWWIFGEALSTFRPALRNLHRAIATPVTAKHRFFVFIGERVWVDSTSLMFALSDAFFLGVLSSKIHVLWATRAGTRLGVGNDPRYNKTRCFETFPFPAANDAQLYRIRDLGESLDAHRKRQQKQYPSLTITDMYNVLEKLRFGETLTRKEVITHEQGLVSVLQQIHDDLDAAVFDAYGWPTSLTDEEILERLVALNAERAAEEQRGIIRWLRPEYQKREAMTQTGADLDEQADVSAPDGKGKKPNWPPTLPEQARAVQAALVTLAAPATPEDIAQCFVRARVDRVTELLDTLASLGQSFQLDDGRFVAQ